MPRGTVPALLDDASTAEEIRERKSKQRRGEGVELRRDCTRWTAVTETYYSTPLATYSRESLSTTGSQSGETLLRGLRCDGGRLGDT